jgi:hypothetical protein
VDFSKGVADRDFVATGSFEGFTEGLDDALGDPDALLTVGPAEGEFEGP